MFTGHLLALNATIHAAYAFTHKLIARCRPTPQLLQQDAYILSQFLVPYSLGLLSPASARAALVPAIRSGDSQASGGTRCQDRAPRCSRGNREGCGAVWFASAYLLRSRPSSESATGFCSGSCNRTQADRTPSMPRPSIWDRTLLSYV